jgi:hypothetical protein
VKRLIVLVLAASLFALQTPASAAYYPSSGYLYYAGAYYAESSLQWSSPGPWASGQPGYEHDLSLNDTYFNSCTSYTNLPNAYDDCPTAGVADPPGTRI